MEYRKIGNDSVSLLGFGCMRFPLTADGKIDEPEAEEMLKKAIDQGVNYIDTAFPYHNGESEPFVGRTIKKLGREKVLLATKLPMWKINTMDDVKETFESQLVRLQTDHIDFYLLHALGKERWEVVKALDIISYLVEQKKQGKIRYIGFSFHDSYDVFEEIINYFDWDFCQIQYNYMDVDVQAGDKGYALTKEKNIPLVIMEPLKGGVLANLPDEVASEYKLNAPNDSIASWSLRWLAAHDNIKVILSGMSTMEQVDDNLKTFSEYKAMTEREMQIVDNVRSTIISRVRNSCTGCRYCMPCPNGVSIPELFRLWNNFGMYGNKEGALARLNNMKEDELPKNCIECGACEAVCPQGISIIDDLKKLVDEIKN